MNGLERLGKELAGEQDALRARRSDRARVRERIGAFVVRRGRSPWLRPGRIALACASAAAAALIVLWVRPAGQVPLLLKVGASGKQAQSGAFLEAPLAAALPLRFSDGTRIDIGPRSRARVVEIDAAGAHLLLESGRANLNVVKRSRAAWRLSVGPFMVRVTGTRFEVRWNPEQDEFQLDLEEGRVEVSGCVFGLGYRMSSGQAVDASCKRGRLHVSDRRRAQPADASAAPQQRADSRAAPVAAPAPAVEGATAPEPRRVRRARSAPAPRAADWRSLALRGQYALAFAAARVSGFEAECEHASDAELALLADTARYAREVQSEAHALRALRRRFPGSSRAGLAAFALGRLEFDGNHAYDRAADWFVTYLKESPRGALSREARGRLIEATLRAGDRPRARALAAAYLRDHPDGPHAELARGLRAP